MVDLETTIRENPSLGVVMAGTGGLRKARFAPRRGDKGKSGSHRVCYAFFPRSGIVLMVVAFGKNDKDNLTAVERNEVKLLLADQEAKLRKGAGW